MSQALPGAVLTLLAVAAWGALHSLLASPPAKRLARRVFGQAADRGYRLAFNVLSIVTLVPVLAIPALEPGPVLYSLRWPWVALALAGQAVCLGVLAVGLLQSDPWHFLGLRQLVRPEVGVSRLIVTGLYRRVRHPLYTAGLAFIWLTPWMSTSLLALNLGLSGYIYIGSIFEERRLVAEFGEAYLAYARQTPRLIPWPARSR
jgi:protein-S-isoprenylcysteine O-methyltransferase Ste14